MEKLWFLVFLLGMSGVLGATPSGGAEARSEDGRLTVLSSWWKPGPDLEGRWWWRDTGAGTAWVRAYGFQAGPLVVFRGGEGARTWGPRGDLPSGHWGVGFDGGPWGLWAVQGNETFEAGAQAEMTVGGLTVAGGGDRTWSLDPAGREPWVDRGRLGLVWDGGPWDAGTEVTAKAPALGALEWGFRGRWAGTWGPWDGAFFGSGAGLGRTLGWTGSGRLGWENWTGTWDGESSDPLGCWSAGWKKAGSGATVWWGAADGLGCRADWAADLGSVDVDIWAAAGWDGEAWTGRTGVSAGAPWDRGTWNAAWNWWPGPEGPVQTVTARWRDQTFEAGIRWRTEGLRLGWVGPGSTFGLTLRVFF